MGGRVGGAVRWGVVGAVFWVAVGCTPPETWPTVGATPTFERAVVVDVPVGGGRRRVGLVIRDSWG